MDERKLTGDLGEAAAAAYLRKHRCRILASQFRCRFGEIDLISLTPEGILCFVEVKTRKSRYFARAADAVTPAKQRRIKMAAQFYLQQTQQDCPCRFDVMEVYPTGDSWQKPEIHYIADAFF